MKKIKRAAALLLVLVLSLSLCACGKSELIGTWEGRLDMTQEMRKAIDEAVGEFDLSLSGGRQMPVMSDYVEEMYLSYSMIFKEDGTYTTMVDESEVDQIAEKLKAGFSDYLRQLFFVLLCETLSQMGMTQEVNSIQELEGLLGITMDEAITEALGMSLDDYMDLVVGESFDQAISIEDLNYSGNFKNKDGKLYLSDGLEYQVDPAVYDLYELEGDTLTVDYRALSDADTVVNLTNHAYFNLAGHDGGVVADHQLTVHAAAYTPAGAGGLRACGRAYPFQRCGRRGPGPQRLSAAGCRRPRWSGRRRARQPPWRLRLPRQRNRAS